MAEWYLSQKTEESGKGIHILMFIFRVMTDAELQLEDVFNLTGCLAL